jgi:excinuclease ABC subunit C
MLKDDKTYPYIKVTVGEEYPRVMFSRQMKKDKSKYFGPYTSAGSVKDTIELLRRLYHIRSCNRSLPKDIGKERCCLNYHIGQCYGVCQGYVSKEDYREQIQGVLSFLNGNFSPILKELEQKMQQCAQEMDFEQAAQYRDLLASVRQVAQKQKISHFDGEDKDILAVATDREDAVIQVFFIRDGKMIGREHFFVKIANEDTDSQILASFLKQYYSGTPFVPRELMLPVGLEEQALLEEWLGKKRGQKVTIRVPKKGEKEKLVELAAKNAQLVLSQDRERIKREEGRTIGAVREIEKLIGLDGIKRMEAYDISNTNGFESVGSMIVYENGKPLRRDYRKFKIRTVSGPDDYASMYEVLYRRFSHGLEEQKKMEEAGIDDEMGRFTKFPDLILMDGGRGQVNVALRVLDELHLVIPVCGMVKDDNHNTRGLYYNNVETPIRKDSEGFKLITRIQDEAHRFAIEYHRSLRSKEQIHSVLDDIKGVGPARRKALMQHFESIEAIREATEEQLMEVTNMNRQTAEEIYRFFRKERP